MVIDYEIVIHYRLASMAQSGGKTVDAESEKAIVKQAFLRAIESIGDHQFKQCSFFIRNVEPVGQQSKAA